LKSGKVLLNVKFERAIPKDHSAIAEMMIDQEEMVTAPVGNNNSSNLTIEGDNSGALTTRDARKYSSKLNY